MKNKDLKQKYDKMHAEGASAWFDDGQAERQAIFEMGEPWEGKTVLEIGCGEGDLLNMIAQEAYHVCGVDYSEQAIITAKEKYPDLALKHCEWNKFRSMPNDILVMQGVMEHLDYPFNGLANMIKRFKPKTVITSMPGFFNTRGIVWHTLDMLGAVMSKTDLHFIDPWQVAEFVSEYKYSLRYESIDHAWGDGDKMIEDLRHRIPLALKDGHIPYSYKKFLKYIEWLDIAKESWDMDEGAINIYRIDI